MFQKMCNLIHQELKFSNMQWLEHQNKLPLKRAKEKTKKLLTSMMQNVRFRDYFVADLMSRCMVLVKTIQEDEDFDITELTVRNMNEMVVSERALNPHVTNFLTKLILSSPSFAPEDLPQLCLRLFNLLLSQVVIFCGEVESKILFKLTQTCGNILQTVFSNVKKFTHEDQIIESFVNNKILQMICLGLDFDTDELNEKKRELLNLQVMLFAIHDEVLRRKLSDFTIQLGLNR